MMNTASKKHVGFTLIELLVVVSIIALLVSILLPSLSKAREQAQLSVCGQTLKQFYLGLQYYMNDNNDMTIPSFMWDTGLAAVGSTNYRSIPNQSYNSPLRLKGEQMDFRRRIDEYFNTPEFWACPGDRGRRIFTASRGSSFAYNWLLLCFDYTRRYPTQPYTVDDVMPHKLSWFTQLDRVSVVSHQWIADPVLIDYYKGDGVYWPHRNKEGGTGLTTQSVFLDGHVARATWIQGQIDADEIRAYYASIKR